MTRLAHDWFPGELPAGTTLGERSWLYSSYALHHCRGQVRIDADCGVYTGTHFELGPQARVEIGAYCTIVGAIIATNGIVTIGDHAFIAHEVVIADSPFALPPGTAASGSAPRLQPRTAPAGIRIDSGAWIGARALILDGAEIGRDAVIGAGAVVSGAVPAGATATGNPARVAAR